MDKGLEAKLDQLVRKIDTLQTTVDRAIAQLDEDRRDLSDIKVALGKSLAVAEGTRDDLNDQTKLVVNKVQENLQPMPDVVSDAVQDAISDIKKKKWYQLFKN